MIGGVVIVAVVALVALWLEVGKGSADPTADLATFVAKRGPLTISVLESGAIKAREQITIKNEVEGRTSIISLVSEGTRVKKGDLLVELDASTLTDSKIDQEIRVQNAEAAYISAKENLNIVKNQAQSDVDVATLNLTFAQLDLQKYTDPNGEYNNELAAAQNAITVAKEEKTRADETLKWSNTLFQEKYISLTELQADQLAVTRSKVKLDLAINDLTLLENFTYKREIEKRKSDVKQAEMALERAEAKRRANVAQAEAELIAKEAEWNRQKDKLAKIQDQLKKTKITAPVNGMVIYATSARGGGFRSDNRQPLAEGVEVFERQDLIQLPTAESATADVDTHEASLEKVRVGFPAIVTVDALPGKKFMGTVGRIAPLPDPQNMWMNPDLKVYKTDIYLEGNEPALRSGMSCKAEIIVEQYQDVVYVPVQAVLRVGGQPTLYVVKGGNIEERKVEIGLDNNRMVKISSGLNEGEVVMLTPPLRAAVVETGLQTSGTNSPGATDTMMERINEKLKAANGTQAGTPGTTSDNAAGQQQGRPEGSSMGSGGGQTGQQQPGGESAQMPSAEQMEKMRQRFESMSPEERQKEMENMKQRFENMSPEEREKMRQRSQGSGGRRQGSRQGQGEGQDQGRSQRQEGGQ